MVIQDNNNQKGVSLIITFFIMIIILAVVLSISVILYSGVKVMRNMGNSVVSFYAGESGIEKVLYYDRQVLPNNSVHCDSDSPCTTSPYTFCNNGICTIPSSRGLCFMLNSANNLKCTTGTAGETSIFCNPIPPATVFPTPPGAHCDFDNCTDCTVSFHTNFNNRTYDTWATISGGNFQIDSLGAFGDTQRKINILISNTGVQQFSNDSTIQPTPCETFVNNKVAESNISIITSAGVDLKGGKNTDIQATIQDGVSIEYVQASVYKDLGTSCVVVTGDIDLTAYGNGYKKPWDDGVVDGETHYYVIIDAEDSSLSLRHHYWGIEPFILPQS